MLTFYLSTYILCVHVLVGIDVIFFHVKAIMKNDDIYMTCRHLSITEDDSSGVQPIYFNSTLLK